MEPLVDSNDFPASRNSTYLNAASVSLMYQGASQAMIEWQQDLADYGTLKFDEVAEVAVFEDLRKVTATLFNVRPEDIAVGSSATEQLASLAWAIAPGPGTNVVGTDIVFPSTVYPWARVARHTGNEVRLAKGQNGYVRLDDLIGLIDDDTAAVCVSHVEFSGGQRYDLAKLAEVAHAHDALLVVDATQSAGMLPIDAAALGLDALVTGAYKWLCGPFGVSVMYLAPHLQSKLDPGLVGWRSHEDIWDFQADRLEMPPTALRFEFSTMAYGCALGLTRAIEYLLALGVDTIFDYSRGLADRLREELKTRGVEIVSPENDAERTAILAVRFPGQDPATVARHLNDQQVVVSRRHDFVRFSPHLYNQPDDIDQALQLIDQLL